MTTPAISAHICANCRPSISTLMQFYSCSNVNSNPLCSLVKCCCENSFDFAKAEPCQSINDLEGIPLVLQEIVFEKRRRREGSLTKYGLLHIPEDEMNQFTSYFFWLLTCRACAAWTAGLSQYHPSRFQLSGDKATLFYRLRIDATAYRHAVSGVSQSSGLINHRAKLFLETY